MLIIYQSSMDGDHIGIVAVTAYRVYQISDHFHQVITKLQFSLAANSRRYDIVIKTSHISLSLRSQFIISILLFSGINAPVVRI